MEAAEGAEEAREIRAAPVDRVPEAGERVEEL